MRNRIRSRFREDENPLPLVGTRLENTRPDDLYALAFATPDGADLVFHMAAAEDKTQRQVTVVRGDEYSETFTIPIGNVWTFIRHHMARWRAWPADLRTASNTPGGRR